MILPTADDTVTVGTLAACFALLTVKHVLADFVFQTRWMALGKDRRDGWALPLLVHCSVHGVLTTALVGAVVPGLWFLGAVDFAVHIVCDRAKGYAVSRAGLGPEDAWFWWLLGIDQALHHATDLALSVVMALALTAAA